MGRNIVKIDDAIFQRDIMRYCVREMMGILSPVEFKVLLMILDRTINWGIKIEAIPVSQFVNGIRKHSGEIHHRGVSASRSSVIQAINSLEDKGLIVSIKEHRRVSYLGLNLKHFSKAMSLPKPKRLKDEDSTDDQFFDDEDSGVESTPNEGNLVQNLNQNTTNLVQNLDSYKEEQDKEEQRDKDEPTPFGSEIESARRKNQEMRQKKMKRRESLLSCERLLAKDLSSFWAESILAFHPGVRVIPLSDLQRKILSKKQTAFMKAKTGTTFAEFLSWSIEEWSDIMRSRFGWMKGDVPDSPAIRFFLNRFDDFFSLYERKDRNWKVAISGGTTSEEQGKALTRERDSLEMERRKLVVERSKVEKRRRRVNISKEDNSQELKQFDWTDENDT